MLKDDQVAVKDTQLKDGGKIMLIGSTVSEVLQVNTTPSASSASSSSGSTLILDSVVILPPLFVHDSLWILLLLRSSCVY